MVQRPYDPQSLKYWLFTECFLTRELLYKCPVKKRPLKMKKKKKRERDPYALTWKEIYYILLNKNAAIRTAWVTWLHLCQNIEGKLFMMYMQIKFLEGYTGNLTVHASGEMRLRRRWWETESLLHCTLHSSWPFHFTMSTCCGSKCKNEPVGQYDLLGHLQLLSLSRLISSNVELPFFASVTTTMQGTSYTLFSFSQQAPEVMTSLARWGDSGLGYSWIFQASGSTTQLPEVIPFSLPEPERHNEADCVSK